MAETRGGVEDQANADKESHHSFGIPLRLTWGKDTDQVKETSGQQLYAAVSQLPS